MDRTFDAGFFDGLTSSLGVYPPVNIFKKRRFNVSNIIDTAKIDANLTDGVLTLTLPKTPESLPKSTKAQENVRKIAIFSISGAYYSYHGSGSGGYCPIFKSNS